MQRARANPTGTTAPAQGGQSSQPPPPNSPKGSPVAGQQSWHRSHLSASRVLQAMSPHTLWMGKHLNTCSTWRLHLCHLPGGGQANRSDEAPYTEGHYIGQDWRKDFWQWVQRGGCREYHEYSEKYEPIWKALLIQIFQPYKLSVHVQISLQTNVNILFMSITVSMYLIVCIQFYGNLAKVNVFEIIICR